MLVLLIGFHWLVLLNFIVCDVWSPLPSPSSPTRYSPSIWWHPLPCTLNFKSTTVRLFLHSSQPQLKHTLKLGFTEELPQRLSLFLNTRGEKSVLIQSSFFWANGVRRCYHMNHSQFHTSCIYPPVLSYQQSACCLTKHFFKSDTGIIPITTFSNALTFFSSHSPWQSSYFSSLLWTVL